MRQVLERKQKREMQPAICLGPVIVNQPYGYAEAGWWWDDDKEWSLADPSHLPGETAEDDYSEDSRP